MLAESEKEFEILKQEISEVKDCITKYISYMIGIIAASGVLSGFIHSNYSLEPSYIIISILGLMIGITMFFSIIWYKFSSHNQYVGYLHLIAQEIGHYNLSEMLKRDASDSDKLYLDDENPIPYKNKNDSSEIIGNIYGWEFTKSRWYNTIYNNELNDIINATSKTKFIFKIPNKYKYKHINEYYNLDSKYFKEIVYNIYKIESNNQPSTIKKILLLINIMLGKDINKIETRVIDNVDKKYQTTSWSYPAKITQIFFFVIFLLTLISSIISIISYDLCLSKLLWLPTLGFLGILMVFLMWCKTFFLGLYDLLLGNKSIDYYCWTFIVFRIQLLNSYNIIPKFFSRSFIRFFKTEMILERMKLIEKSILGSDTNCCVCYPIKNTDSKIICKNHLEDYKKSLSMYKELDSKLKLYAHPIIKEKIKETLNEK